MKVKSIVGLTLSIFLLLSVFLLLSSSSSSSSSPSSDGASKQWGATMSEYLSSFVDSGLDGAGEEDVNPNDIDGDSSSSFVPYTKTNQVTKQKVESLRTVEYVAEKKRVTLIVAGSQKCGS